MSGNADHWDGIYGSRAEVELTWFEASPQLSRDLVRRYLGPGDGFVDIGAGASRLVDTLLDDGLGPLSVLDLSAAALRISRQRLGPRADQVTWIEADVTRWRPDRAYGVWHDRAVFHFLTDPQARAAYVRSMQKALAPGRVAIIATFAEDGPQMCSGLPVVRYSSDELAAELARHFAGTIEAVESHRHAHVTPKGNRQSFQYTVLKSAAD